MLYQMGIGRSVIFGFLAALAATARTQLIETGEPDFLFAFVVIVTVSANAVLQEEAFFSPLALGFCLLPVRIYSDSPKIVWRWIARFKTADAMADRSSRPRTSPRQAGGALVERAGLRRHRCTHKLP